MWILDAAISIAVVGAVAECFKKLLLTAGAVAGCAPIIALKPFFSLKGMSDSGGLRGGFEAGCGARALKLVREDVRDDDGAGAAGGMHREATQRTKLACRRFFGFCAEVRSPTQTIVTLT